MSCVKVCGWHKKDDEPNQHRKEDIATYHEYYELPIHQINNILSLTIQTPLVAYSHYALSTLQMSLFE